MPVSRWRKLAREGKLVAAPARSFAAAGAAETATVLRATARK